jgi:pimeloyl-ACP methyl ester carboxylesterase
MSEALQYDELGLFHENAEEYGLPFDAAPVVARQSVDVGGGQQVSALVWGTSDPELVLVHGGAQNAHTWDTVAMALGRPLVAIDLPGHGHSDWRDDHDYTPPRNAEAAAAAIAALAPNAAGVVGMSLGGLTSTVLAARRPDLVRRLLIVDVTPGVDREKADAIITFVSGPERFATFDEILERTVQFNPTRSVSSLRRGILHNAHQDDDGSWMWRYDRGWAARAGDRVEATYGGLWDDLEAIEAPLMLARGALSPVVSDDDVVELLRRRPEAQVHVVDGAGHSIQGDRPLELAALIESFFFGA